MAEEQVRIRDYILTCTQNPVYADQLYMNLTEGNEKRSKILYSPLTTINDNFNGFLPLYNFKWLRTINLDSNHLRYFDLGIVPQYIEEIRLSNNEIAEIKNSRRDNFLNHLEILDLSFNKLKTIKQHCCYIYNVKYLNLSNNELRGSLDNCIDITQGKLSRLETLYLDNNNLVIIDILPKNLIMLLCNTNCLQSICVINARRLESIEANNNMITRLTIDAPSLNRISLLNNATLNMDSKYININTCPTNMSTPSIIVNEYVFNRTKTDQYKLLVSHYDCDEGNVSNNRNDPLLDDKLNNATSRKNNTPRASTPTPVRSNKKWERRARRGNKKHGNLGNLRDLAEMMGLVNIEESQIKMLLDEISLNEADDGKNLEMITKFIIELKVEEHRKQQIMGMEMLFKNLCDPTYMILDDEETEV